MIVHINIKCSVDKLAHSAVPENTHIHPEESHLKLQHGGGFQKPKLLKGPNLEFLKAQGVPTKHLP